MKRALLVLSLFSACEGAVVTQPDPPAPVDQCAGLPTLTAEVVPDTLHVNGAANVIASGGTGRYRYHLGSATPAGALSGNRYVAGLTPGSDSIIVTDDCDHSARVGVEIIASFAVRPSRARVPPGTSFTFTAVGATPDPRTGTPQVTYSAQMLGSHGSLSADGEYVAGPDDDTDIIIARDVASGDTIAAVIEVSSTASFRPAFARLALPTGSFAPLSVLDGTGVVTWSLRAGDPGAVEQRGDAWFYVAPDGGAGGESAVLTAWDAVLDAGAELKVRVLTELLRTDLTPQGHRTDLGTLLTADFDGDGLDDVALAVPESDLGRSQGGAVFIFKGTANGLPDTPTWTLLGASDTAALGTVMAAGDLNGDGRADLALSAPGDDITLNNSGAVYLYTFGADGPELLQPPLTGLGAANFGTALAIEDVDGDGDDDLIVGSPGADVGGGSARGVIDLFRVTPGLPLGDLGDVRLSGIDLNVDGGFTKTNTLNAGRSVVAADLNADTLTDLAFITSVNNALQPDGGVRTQKVYAVQVHLGRGSGDYDDLPDLFVHVANGPDTGNENGLWRLDFMPASGDRPALLVAYNDSVTSPDLRAGDAGTSGGTRAGAVYLFDLTGAPMRPTTSTTPLQLTRADTWARIYGNSANIRAGRFAVVDADGDASPELVLGAYGANGTGTLPDGGSVSLPGSGRLDFYSLAQLSRGAAVNRPDFTRSGLNRSDRAGAALTVWNGRLASFNSRASTTVGDFTGRLDVFTPAAGDPRAWAVQSMAVPARVGGQQFGTAIEAGARGGHVTALVNVPFWNGPSSDNLGGDVPSGRAWYWDSTTPATPLLVSEGTDSSGYASDAGVRAYGGNNQARDVALTDFDGDGREDAVVAAGRFQHPTLLADGGLNSAEYAVARPECAAPTGGRYGAALVMMGQADGTFREGFRVWGPYNIAGCTQADGGTVTECVRTSQATALIGRFDFNGDGQQDLAMLRANGFEVFTGRALDDASLAKPSLACDPYFSFPYTPWATSAPASLGDLDNDGCDELTFRYLGTAQPGNLARQGIVIVYGFGSSCGSSQPRWLRISGDTEVGVSPMRLGVAMARARQVLADGRDAVAVTADLYAVAGDPQPTVLLLPVAQLNALKPTSGERLVAIQGSAQLTVVPLVPPKYTLSFGRAMAGDLDVDGDGQRDLVVSATGASENGDGTGAVYVFGGGTVTDGKTQPAMIVFPDATERASFGQDLSLSPPSGGAPAGLGIGAPLSERWGTANGSAWVLPLDF